MIKDLQADLPHLVQAKVKAKGKKIKKLKIKREKAGVEVGV